MRHLFPSLLLALSGSLALAPLVAPAQTPAWTGAAQCLNPTPADNTQASGRTLATDAANNAYVGGTLDADASGAPGTRTFGSTSLSSTALGSGFVAKLSPAQQWLWAVRASTNGFESTQVDHVVATPAGEVFAAGRIGELSAATFSLGNLTQAITPANTIFIARLSASGQPQWVALPALPGAPFNRINAEVTSLAYDAGTNTLVVVGYYAGAALTLGNTTLPSAPASGLAGFIARLSAGGQWLSATSLLPTGTDPTREAFVYQAVCGPQGQLTSLIFLKKGSLTLGSTTVASASNNDVKTLVAQQNAAGQWQWVAQPAGPAASNVDVYDLDTDRAGNLWVLGGDAAGVQLGGFTLPANTEAFVARLSPAGQWGTVGTIGVAGGRSIREARDLAVDGAGQRGGRGPARRGRQLHLRPPNPERPAGFVQLRGPLWGDRAVAVRAVGAGQQRRREHQHQLQRAPHGA